MNVHAAEDSRKSDGTSEDQEVAGQGEKLADQIQPPREVGDLPLLFLKGETKMLQCFSHLLLSLYMGNWGSEHLVMAVSAQ